MVTDSAPSAYYLNTRKGKKLITAVREEASSGIKGFCASRVGTTTGIVRSNIMNKFLYLITSMMALGLLTTSVFGKDPVNVAGASGVALDGYDPVAFFIDKKPMNGDPAISASYNGAKYFFASKEHKVMFEADPQKYVPQFGGYCAFGVAVDALFPVDINTWQTRNGKLYLNLNPTVLKLFNKDTAGYIVRAEKNWPDLVKKNTK